MQRIRSYEEMTMELERALCLLSLVSEEIDEAPHVTAQEDAWQAVVYCNRANVSEALVCSVFTMIKAQKELLEKWTEEDLNERKKE